MLETTRTTWLITRNLLPDAWVSCQENMAASSLHRKRYSTLPAISYTETLTIRSNDPDEDPAQVTLLGTGT